jgi:hypothetical protein
MRVIARRGVTSTSIATVDEIPTQAGAVERRGGQRDHRRSNRIGIADAAEMVLRIGTRRQWNLPAPRTTQTWRNGTFHPCKMPCRIYARDAEPQPNYVRILINICLAGSGVVSREADAVREAFRN